MGQAAAVMKSILMKEFAPTADVLMEAVVSKDYKKWLDALKIDSGGTGKQRQEFDKLHEDFTQVLNSSITAIAVQALCRSVVGSGELFTMVRARATELSRLAEANQLTAAAEEDPS